MEHRLEGFRYQPDLIEEELADALVADVRELPFRKFEFHGYKGKRRVAPCTLRFRRKVNTK